VAPLQPPAPPNEDALTAVLSVTRVPVWVPWPLPVGWLVAGAVTAGDDRTGGVGCAVALSGPAPLGGPADLVLVAEEPGVGIGAGLAGLDSADPGPGAAVGAPVTRVSAASHPTPMWSLPQVHGDDRAVYVGEADGCWLWALCWPSEVSLVLHDSFELVDLREPGHQLDLPFGAPSPRLPG
jgi:hypothetical protein